MDIESYYMKEGRFNSLYRLDNVDNSMIIYVHGIKKNDGKFHIVCIGCNPNFTRHGYGRRIMQLLKTLNHVILHNDTKSNKEFWMKMREDGLCD